jgi:hypothetical protein
LSCLCVAAIAGLSACGDEAVSTREIEQAAIERARQELRLPAGTALTATVWTGAERDGELTYCGSVGSGPGATPIQPQRFAAHGDPIEFFIFENAHDADPASQPGKFESWSAVCGNAQPA